MREDVIKWRVESVEDLLGPLEVDERAEVIRRVSPPIPSATPTKARQEIAEQLFVETMRALIKDVHMSGHHVAAFRLVLTHFNRVFGLPDA